MNFQKTDIDHTVAALVVVDGFRALGLIVPQVLVFQGSRFLSDQRITVELVNVHLEGAWSQAATYVVQVDLLGTAKAPEDYEVLRLVKGYDLQLISSQDVRAKAVSLAVFVAQALPADLVALGFKVTSNEKEHLIGVLTRIQNEDATGHRI